MVEGWLISDIYVLLITLMMLFLSLEKKQRVRQDRTFIMLLLTVTFLLIGDMMSRANPDGKAGLPDVLSRIGNYIIFAGDPVGYLAGMVYIDSWIRRPDAKRGSVTFHIVLGYILLNFILVTISEIGSLGWFYSFPNRIYTRGPLFLIRGVLNMVFCLVIGMYVLFQRNQIWTDYKKYVLAFPLIVLISGMMQVFIGGVAYEYAGTIFACLLLYIYVQNHNMDRDYLTGLLNRRGIDRELHFRIEHIQKGKAFCTYMLDLDFFKEINDECGHESGDDALKCMARMLGRSFGYKSIIGRYGGDEFLIINAASTKEEAEKYIQRLEKQCREFNDSARYPFRLGFSIGYDIYSADHALDPKEYFRHLDALMYKEKERHHAGRTMKTGKE
jgi:diguanylate cyclase (GGDEF)-like protein